MYAHIYVYNYTFALRMWMEHVVSRSSAERREDMLINSKKKHACVCTPVHICVYNHTFALSTHICVQLYICTEDVDGAGCPSRQCEISRRSPHRLEKGPTWALLPPKVCLVVYIYTFMYVWMCVHVYVCMHVCTCLCMYTCVCSFMYVYAYTHVYVYV
jgi:hypothetical protein